jgi:hypothetical protein
LDSNHDDLGARIQAGLAAVDHPLRISYAFRGEFTCGRGAAGSRLNPEFGL